MLQLPICLTQKIRGDKMETGKINHIVLSAVVLILFFSVLSVSLKETVAADNEKYEQVATELTKKLSSKINLTSDQTDEIKNILVDYQKEVIEAEDVMNEEKTEIKTDTKETATHEQDESTKEQIESVLDEKQKTAYVDYRDEWWKEVQDRVQLLKAESEIKTRNNNY
jgi:hypothetical protein